MHQSCKTNYYSLLGLHPSASVIDIRRAYRELSKQYHPDTTVLPALEAITKFQQINEAYATLSKPEQRFNYDLKIGYSRFGVIAPPPDLNRPISRSYNWTKSAYLDASDRPLSGGELFALFILGLTLLGCLLLAIAVGIMRGEDAFQPLTQQSPPIEQQFTQIIQSNFW
jgi:DnaJ domain